MTAERENRKMVTAIKDQKDRQQGANFGNMLGEVTQKIHQIEQEKYNTIISSRLQS